MKIHYNKVLFVCLLMLGSLGFAQTQTNKINQQNFEFKHTKTDTTLLQTVEIYRNNQKVLTHILYNDDGDCSSIQKELGTYEIKDNQLIFYTYWVAADRMGTLIYPYGFRKQVYNVDNSGKLKRLNTEIYLEDKFDYQKSDGLDYLQKAPKTAAEKQLLQQYIKTIEEKYQAHFVTGAQKKLLQSEVRKKLTKELQTETKDWQEIYGTINAD